MEVSGEINSPITLSENSCSKASSEHANCVPTSTALNLSSIPTKTVPFFPRVIFSVQQPVSTFLNQAGVLQTHYSIASSITNHNILSQTPQQQNIPNLSMSTSSVSSSVSSGNQFFPLILAAAPAPALTPHSSAINHTPIQLHVSNFTSGSPVPNSSTSNFILHSNVTSSALPANVHPIVSNTSISPRSFSFNSNTLTSTASLTNRNTNTASTTIASVVLSPHLQNSLQPTLSVRFTAHCGTTTTTVNSTTCSLLFDTPGTSIAVSPQKSHSTSSVNSSTASSLSSSTLPSSSLLMSSAISSPRVRIHKPSSLTLPNQFISSSTSVGEHTPSKITLTLPDSFSANAAATTNTTATSSTINTTFLVHDQTTNALHTQSHTKGKLLSFASPVSTSLRLFTTTPTNSNICKPISASSGFIGTMTTKSLTSASNVWPGLTVTPGASLVSQTPNVVTIQSTPSLIVQAPPDSVVSATSSTQTSLTPSLMTSLRGLTGSTTNSGPTVPLPGGTPTVLTFNLSGSNVSTPANNSVPSVLGGQVRQVSPGSATTPLIIRANGPSAVSFVAATTTASSTTPLTPASLLKPFNLTIGTSGSSNSTFSTTPIVASSTGVPHIVPVNIAPAKLAPLQSSGSIPTSLAPSRPNFIHSNTSAITAHRQGTSVFPQPSRKRARKQQLASTFPSAVIVTSGSVNTSASSASSSATNNSQVTAVVPIASGTRVTNTPTIVSMTKASIQPQPSNISHSNQANVTSIRTNALTSDSIPKVNFSTHATGTPSSTNCPPVLNPISTGGSTGASGLMGIRLLSVRTAPAPLPNSGALSNISCFQTAAVVPITSTNGIISRGSDTVVNSSDPTSMMVMTPTSPTTSCATQLRTSSSALQMSDLQSAQATTVYVLTTSAYSVLTNNTNTALSTVATTKNASPEGFAPLGSTTIPDCYTAAVVVPGSTTAVAPATPGLLQVRFRSQTSSDNSVSDSIQPSQVPPSITQTISTDGMTQDRLSSLESSSTTSWVDTKPSDNSQKHLRNTPLSSNSLLHRHLVSSHKRVHSESLTEDPASVDASKQKLATSDYALGSANFDRDAAMSSGWHSPHHKDVRYMDRKHSASVSEAQGGTSAECSSVEMEGPNFDHNATDPEHISMSKCAMANEFEDGSDVEEIVESESTKVSTRSTKMANSGILLTVDPTDGREWVLNGRPTRPSITMRGASTPRGGLAYRSKSTHFLNHSEIRYKTALKGSSLRRSNSPSEIESTGTSRQQSSRRRRRANSRFSNVSSTSRLNARESGELESIDSNKDIESNALNSDEARHRLLQEVLAVRLAQSEAGFLRYPLTTSSTLNLSGWRALRCADNLDLLAYTELQTMQSLDNLGSSLNSCLKIDEKSSLNFPQTLSAIMHSLDPKTSSTETNKIQTTEDNCSKPGTSSTVSDRLASNESTKNEVTQELDRVLELIKGVLQRKRHLLGSIQRLKHLTKNLVDHFSPDADQLIEELEAHINASKLLPSTPPLNPQIKTTLLDVSFAATAALRRSARKHSPSVLPTRRARGRGASSSSLATSDTKSSGSLIKNVPNNFTGNTSKLCNGGAIGDFALQK